MQPFTEGQERASELSRLIDAHQRHSMNMEHMEARAAKLESKLEDAGFNVTKQLDNAAVSKEIRVSNPHVVQYYEAIHRADRLVSILEQAWIAGVIEAKDRGSEFWSLKRVIEKEYNFIARIADACRNRFRWDPFPMFGGTKTRLEREEREAAKAGGSSASNSDKGKSPAKESPETIDLDEDAALWALG